MRLRDINMKSNYDSGEDDILNEFYIKALESAVEYDRIAGFFSSTSLAIASRGLKGFLNNEGKMRLLVSPRLSEEDIEVLNKIDSNDDEYISSVMMNELEDMEDLMKSSHFTALGWLLANDILEMKVVVVLNKNGKPMSEEEIEKKGLFHIKVGIIKDFKGDTITFSGSVNESANGWKRNIEEFKVFKDWIQGQDEYCQSDIKKFQSYWSQSVEHVKVYDIPNAIKDRILQVTKTESCSKSELKKMIKEIEDDKKKKQNPLSLFFYQQEALDKWIKNDNRLILEMATGTGKTRTAIACIHNILQERKKLLVVVVTPQGTLSLQWKKEMEKLGITADVNIVADKDNKRWRDQFVDGLLSISLALVDTVFVYTTYDTYKNKDFIEIIMKNADCCDNFLIADEVHSAGSDKRSKGLVEEYNIRLGLSATPERWFDNDGTKRISDYFGGEKYVFSINDALHTINPLTGKTYLTPYKYIPIFVSLNEDELEEYERLTKMIVRNSGSSDNINKEMLDSLMSKRAEIHKSAESKYEAFSNLIDELGSDINDLLVFASYVQIDQAREILTSKGISTHKYTQSVDTKQLNKYGGDSEREYLIKQFKSGSLQSLLAIKCLDEGIDIPSAQTGILMFNSTNPREYIQRIGRIIRRFEGKEESRLFDFIVVPSYDALPEKLVKIEKLILKKEMIRVMEIAKNAINSTSVMKQLYDVMEV